MKSSLLKYLKLSLALLFSLLASSCLQHETTITLNKDGSGTIVDETTLGAQAIGMIAQISGPGQPDPIQEMFSEEKSKAKVGNMGEGVEFVKIEPINDGGKKGARVHYKFADINKITLNPSSSLDDMNPGVAEAEVKPEDHLKFKYVDGKLSLISNIKRPDALDKMDMANEAPENPEKEAMARQMMGDMQVALKINFPGGIDNSNATYVDGNTVTLMYMNMGKLLDQKNDMKKIAETAKTDKKAAQAAFAKLNGIKMETKEDFTVTLK